VFVVFLTPVIPSFKLAYMIIRSKLNSNEYFYVMIPRTGTYSYSTLFDIKHNHIPYARRPEEAKNISGVAVIRHPLDRFISSLYNLQYSIGVTYKSDTERKLKKVKTFQKAEVLKFETFNFMQTEEMFYDCVYSFLGKNCIPKGEKIFQEHLSMMGSSSHFKTQVEYAYHPNVKLFRYENIGEFNNWIKNILGYDINLLTRINQSKMYNLNLPVDTTTTKFKELVKYLFHDDFKIFGYAI